MPRATIRPPEACPGAGLRIGRAYACLTPGMTVTSGPAPFPPVTRPSRSHSGHDQSQGVRLVDEDCLVDLAEVFAVHLHGQGAGQGSNGEVGQVGAQVDGPLRAEWAAVAE